MAIKTLYQTHMKNTDLKVFEREVEILKQLHHPNVRTLCTCLLLVLRGVSSSDLLS